MSAPNGATGTIGTMASDSVSEFVQTYGGRQARDHWSDILGNAARGGLAVIQKRGADQAAVVVGREPLEAALAQAAPFAVEVSFYEGQVSLWIDGLPVDAGGSSLEEAEDALLDALLDYADTWVETLRFAPNHKDKAGYVLRVLMASEDRESLHRVVFGESSATTVAG